MRQQLAETISPRTLIFGMKDCLVYFFKIYTNVGPGVPKGAAAVVLGSKIRYTENCLLHNCWAQIFKILYIYVALANRIVLYQVCSNGGLRV